MEEKIEVPTSEIKVLITYDLNTGNLQLTSKALQDKTLMYGILETAKFAVVQTQIKEQPKGNIIQGIMPFVRKKYGG